MVVVAVAGEGAEPSSGRRRQAAAEVVEAAVAEEDPERVPGHHL